MCQSGVSHMSAHVANSALNLLHRDLLDRTDGPMGPTISNHVPINMLINEQVNVLALAVVSSNDPHVPKGSSRGSTVTVTKSTQETLSRLSWIGRSVHVVEGECDPNGAGPRYRCVGCRSDSPTMICLQTSLMSLRIIGS